jgi:cytoskeletal protein RodZ
MTGRMLTVADQLRSAREAQNLTVHQVAEMTKIRTDHIRALDEGNYDVFSAPVYIRGSVRAYATAVKLDVARVLELLGEELGRSPRHQGPPALSPRKRTFLDMVMYQFSKLQWKVVLPLIAVIATILIGYFIYKSWNEQHSRNPLAGVKPGIYKPTKKSGETLPLPKQ